MSLSALLKSVTSVPQTHDDYYRYLHRILCVNTKVCFRGPFDRLLGLCALQTAFRKEKGDIGKEAEEKEKGYRSFLPVALFQNSTAIDSM